MTRSIKQQIHKLLVSFSNWLNQQLAPKRLLVVRLDAIGDYILFRNFLQVLKNSKKFKGYSITLLGNSVWKDIAENFDNEYVDKFIWVDKNELNSTGAFWYLSTILSKIRIQQYKIILHPTYSREFLNGDFLLSLIEGDKIGYIGDYTNITPENKEIGDTYYNRLIPAENSIKFEFYRNSDFFSTLLQEDITFQKPFFTLGKIKKKNQIIIFPGAGIKFRRWDASNFKELCNHILVTYPDTEIILAGGESDVTITEEIIQDLDSIRVTNLAGQKKLHEFIHLVHQSLVLVSNETSAVHIASAVDTNVICISNGNHYGRFNPYPVSVNKKVTTLYPYEVTSGSHEESIKKYGTGSDLDINLVSVSMVINTLDSIVTKALQEEELE
ncbi:glycosyltransferase family 9 protein [Cytophagaceae bacterium YF14B1]|uniref:Glycosyltransferase family 9 protein n=1 Tax=Xanthocytophaga flava TaxID=3048013 RepID=A0AAE3QT21_9BACT|nr:glycosyltransferase family 9 protein [Xanthocytophaga flavus]MDJ1482168.1 glycosyltransferase family 9 protein [Xanthocytophaga flavus]